MLVCVSIIFPGLRPKQPTPIREAADAWLQAASVAARVQAARVQVVRLQYGRKLQIAAHLVGGEHMSPKSLTHLKLRRFTNAKR